MNDYSKFICNKYIVCKPSMPFFFEKCALFIHIGGPANCITDYYIEDEMAELGILVTYKDDYIMFTSKLNEKGIQNGGPYYISERVKTIYNLLLQVAPVKYEPDFEVVFPELAQFLK